MKKLIIILLMLLTFFIITICETEEGQPTESLNKNENISILISKNFGKEVMSSKIVKFTEGKTVMDILAENYDVETAYSGAFVTSINGIISHTKAGANSGFDWFYFVNGVETNIGANEYLIKKGDEIWWDFREWDMESFNK